jgi:heme/copper-type cytochrome/quinol oxidase subunit 4
MDLLRRHASGVWLLLMVATVITTWVLAKDAVAMRVGTVAIVLIAALKVRLVLLHFMELRHAPRALRVVFELWVLAVSGALIALYLRTPPTI